jgi:DNA-binding NarL/FixJ family response regulator
VRVALCDDSGLFRAGLAALLGGIGVEVVAQVDSPGPLLAAVDDTRPDVVVVDLRLPPTFTDEGITTALQLRALHAAMGVLVLSTYAETEYAARLLQDGGTGVGYLLKDRVDDAASLLNALERVARGETVLDPVVVMRLLERRRAQSALDALTQRETEVLALLAEGRTNSAIADALVLSTKTVETHVASTFTKLGLAEDRDSNRRVLAVITYLRAGGFGR